MWSIGICHWHWLTRSHQAKQTKSLELTKIQNWYSFFFMGNNFYIESIYKTGQNNSTFCFWLIYLIKIIQLHLFWLIYSKVTFVKKCHHLKHGMSSYLQLKAEGEGAGYGIFFHYISGQPSVYWGNHQLHFTSIKELTNVFIDVCDSPSQWPPVSNFFYQSH